MMPILTEPMKNYLLNDSKKGYTAEVKSAYNRRIVEYAKKGIEDLTLLAKKLPEDLQAKIFNEDTLRPLISSLFHFYRPEMGEEILKRTLGLRGERMIWVPTPLDKELESRRRRIVRLCYLTLDIIGDNTNTWQLAPEVMDTLIKAGLKETFDTLIGLKAIYLEGFKQSS